MQVTEGTLPAEITDLTVGYRRLPAGKLANAVTWMEARAPLLGLARPLAIKRITTPDCASYRAIFLESALPGCGTACPKCPTPR
ncbi:hypothetical protein [Mesorhizobium sp. B2-3-11]|uniref:hypothetical protein n=1 Tax=Mesorhizobium sp. B2-3-11 TaxID=2589953 RepID=UPI001FF054A5|nr:hypothetical protein [Mesorhizobium sp. B2-3-11]